MGRDAAVPRNADEAEFPLSLEQTFLRSQHEDDGSSAGFGDRAVSSGGWRVTGEIDVDDLRHALLRVVERHEPLRSTIVTDSEEWYQRVGPPAPPALVLRDLVGRDGTRDVRAEEFYNEIESDTFDPKESPALRAHLGRFDSRDSVLVLVACLPLIDVWSLNVVMADLMEYYAAIREGREPRLPEVENYRGYVSGEQERWSGATIERAREYWNAALAGARPLAMTADHPPGDGSVTSCRRFSVGPELGNAALGLARELNCSLFMLLQAVHLVHLHRLTGQADGVVWTLTPGPARNQRATRDMVGYFVNMSPLRVDISGCGTLRETVARVRAFCLESYRNEIPFVRLVEGAPELMATLEQGGLVVPGFAVFQNPPAKHEDTPGSLVHVPLRRRMSQTEAVDIPDDAILWTVEASPSGEFHCALSHSATRFDPSTVAAIASGFLSLLESAVAAPDSPLDQLRLADSHDREQVI